MAKAKKPKSQWVCTECGATSSGWYGRCPSCQAWNTIVEQVEAPTAGERVRLGTEKVGKVVPVSAANEAATDAARAVTGIGELDRVLGGGLVPGSIVLLGGPPGIGKSTLLLQAGAALSQNGRVLYASGEESVAQIGNRARRLGADGDALLLMAETRIEAILQAAEEHQPGALFVDSIQTVYSDEQEGLPGNIGQIRSVTGHLVSWAKTKNVPVVVVGHVTKDGQLAGPRLLEHMVDAVLAFDGDEDRATRLLRATKNRFGSTQELGVFEMASEGLREIPNPSEAFMADRPEPAIGAAVTATLEGSRPLLVEIQGLTSTTEGHPRRTCVGVDGSRVAMLIAVLQRHAGLDVGGHDVFVNVAGGLRLHEPAADLAVAMAVAGSHLRKAITQGTAVIGEVGLTGELRPVPRLESRLQEAARLGLSRALVPAGRRVPKKVGKLQVVAVRTIGEALEHAF